MLKWTKQSFLKITCKLSYRRAPAVINLHFVSLKQNQKKSDFVGVFFPCAICLIRSGLLFFPSGNPVSFSLEFSCGSMFCFIMTDSYNVYCFSLMIWIRSFCLELLSLFFFYLFIGLYKQFDASIFSKPPHLRSWFRCLYPWLVCYLLLVEF